MTCGLVALAVGALWIVARMSRRLALLAKLFRALAVAAVVLTGCLAMAIAMRSLGDWGRLKAQLSQRHADVLACASCPWPQRHSRTDDPLWEFRFTEQHSPVRLFVRRAVPAPEILVDFGHGGVAMFDLTTMVVTYSD